MAVSCKADSGCSCYLHSSQTVADHGWLWQGYRWSIKAHRWDRAFLLLLALCFSLLTGYQVWNLALFVRDSWQHRAFFDLSLGVLAFAGMLGFAYGNTVWLLYRWGSLNLFERELLSGANKRPQATDAGKRIVLLVPSYREDPEQVRLSLLSAALQSYPDLEIVVLLDDPEAEALDRFEKLAAELRRFLQGLTDYDAAIARIEVERLRMWQSGIQAQMDFVQTTLDPWLTHWRCISPEEAPESVRQLRGLARRSIRVFSRKRYANLTQRPTKAMNINAFLSLLGGRWVEGQERGKQVLLPASPGDSALWDLGEPELISVLDADTVIRFDYVDQVIAHLDEVRGGRKVGAAYVMARPQPSVRGRLHDVAGIQTDLMAASLHYGGNWFAAGYWSGCNGLLRWAALQDIVRMVEDPIGRRVPVYLPDLPSEDTICSVWMLAKGWGSKGILAPTVRTEVPDTFAKLLIQRKRWSSSGYHGIPGVLSHLGRNWWRPAAWVEFMIRFSYLISIGPVSCVVLLALLSMLPVNMGAEAAWICGILYYCSVVLDLVRIGQPWHTIWRVAALNFTLLPVAILAVFSIVRDVLTGRKHAFHRTPRSGESSSVSVQYRVIASLMVLALVMRIVLSGVQSLAGTVAALINIGLIVAGWHLISEKTGALAPLPEVPGSTGR